ncbi:hypothetical protein CHS0354_028229 [Potamilus streckersoni]|uniref:Uncharacterized protein n=1 Tax=Potamilus streckersoni TaxID=2493646 RepID=A0AAE0RTP4_9BIVA|nr:hypothetical protein CHS0354_028229 [Potamilus streckersoni]
MPAQYIQRFSDDPLFSVLTVTAIIPKFAKRRRLTRINVYSLESVHPGDKYIDCFTGSLQDQYLTKSLPTSCQTNRGRFVRKQLSPVGDMVMENIKNYFNNYASNSSEDENGDQCTFCTSKNEKRECTSVLSPRGKRMILKSAEKRFQSKKRKNNDYKSNRSEIDPDSCDMVEWSRAIAVLTEKAQHMSKSKPSKDGSHHTWSTDCFNNDRCSIKLHATYTSTPTRSFINGSVCERFQKERNSFYNTKSTIDSDSSHFYESRKNVRKRPVMGNVAKFASIASISLGVLTEFKRNVHLKYGDRKRRRIKTNGILKLSTTLKVTIINDILKSAGVSETKTNE